MKSIAIFASGSGSNAQEIIRYFKGHQYIKVSLVVTNKKDAGVLNVAKYASIPTKIIHKEDIYPSANLLNILHEHKIDFIVLAGFLWLLPTDLIQAYTNKITNIHPSLLPKYGGKGMYGHFVHEAVKANHEQESGITIHLVNEKYDEGRILCQKSCQISDKITANEIASKILELEHKYYSKTIEKYMNELFKLVHGQ